VNITDRHRDVAALALGKIAGHDPRHRKPDAMIVEAWAEALAHHGLDNTQDALDAVRDHYVTQTGAQVMLVGDLASRMRAARRDRQGRETEDERQARIAANDAKLAPNVAAAEQRKREIARFVGRTATVPEDAA
jgi:hypothetical protein